MQTFKAPTMAAALQQVKTTMGPDAVILHTRTYRLRGWIPLVPGKEVVEVTAGRGLGGGRRRRRRRPPPRSTTPAPASWPPAPAKSPGGSVAGLAVYGGGQGAPAAPPAVVHVPPARPVTATRSPTARRCSTLPAAGNALILSVSNEVAA